MIISQMGFRHNEINDRSCNQAINPVSAVIAIELDKNIASSAQWFLDRTSGSGTECQAALDGETSTIKIPDLGLMLSNSTMPLSEPRFASSSGEGTNRLSSFCRAYLSCEAAKIDNSFAIWLRWNLRFSHDKYPEADWSDYPSGNRFQESMQLRLAGSVT